MTNEIYYPYFVVDALLSNGSSLNISDLKPYIFVKMSYTNKELIDITLEFEPCYYRKQDLFLNKDEKTLNDDGDYQSSWSICLKNPIELGFIGDANLGILNITSLNFQIFPCTGESFCKNSSEIERMLRLVSIFINVPKTTYEFSNKINPRKHNYERQRYIIDFINNKYINSYLMPTNIYSDFGYFSEDYRLDATDFNIDQQTLDVFYRGPSEAIFTYYIKISTNTQNYYRRNQKLYEIFGSFGGIMGIIIKLASFICTFYNGRLMRKKVINTSFQLVSESKDQKKKSKKIGLFQRIKNCFNISRLFQKNRDSFYKNSMFLFYEYMDIKNIIKKLQDIEKLKQILLDDEQKELFETIPKPVIFDQEKSLLFYSKKKKKKTTIIDTYKRINTVYDNLQDKNSKVNQRLMTMLDQNEKKIIDIYEKDNIKLKFDNIREIEIQSLEKEEIGGGEIEQIEVENTVNLPYDTKEGNLKSYP